jgi:di/tricarboxylate transporter
VPAPQANEKLRGGDVLIVKADPDDLSLLVEAAGLELVGSQDLAGANLNSELVMLMEAVVAHQSEIEGETAASIDLRRRHGVNLLAVARQGARLSTRLDRIRFRTGDVLLLQGRSETLPEVLTALGCLPLAERRLRLGRPRRLMVAVGLFVVGVTLTGLGLLPVQAAFVGVVLGMLISGVLPLREAYASIDWPILVLLGAMIPVAGALESTGGALLIAETLLSQAARVPTAAMLALVLVATMFLSDVVNNAAAAMVMAPIGIAVSVGLGVSVDPFLMAVAVGASCAFLTPIGHQSNALVMGPGGYHFGDYWRMGLPLEMLIVVVAVPAILWVWPL